MTTPRRRSRLGRRVHGARPASDGVTLIGGGRRRHDRRCDRPAIAVPGPAATVVAADARHRLQTVTTADSSDADEPSISARLPIRALHGPMNGRTDDRGRSGRDRRREHRLAIRTGVPDVELDVPVRQRLQGNPRRRGGGTQPGLLLARRALRRRTSRRGRGDDRVGLRGDDPARAVPVPRHRERPRLDDAASGANGIFGDAERTHTRVVEHGHDACIFLNRPGFEGGAGCALHIAAVDAGDSPTEWKPSVCWQLPLRIDWQEIDDDTESATVRRWSRADWGEHGTHDGVVLHRATRGRRGIRRHTSGRRIDARGVDRPRRRARLRRAAPPTRP